MNEPKIVYVLTARLVDVSLNSLVCEHKVIGVFTNLGKAEKAAKEIKNTVFPENIIHKLTISTIEVTDETN